MRHQRFENKKDDVFSHHTIDGREENCNHWTVAALAVSTLLQGASASASYSNSKDQANAIKEQGEIDAGERAKQTVRLQKTQKASFLNSGISLTGEGTPQNMFDETFDTGLEDIKNIKNNASQQSKNIMGAARAKLFSDIGGMVSNVAGGISGAKGSTMGTLNSGYSATASGTFGQGVSGAGYGASANYTARPSAFSLR